jgi:hypothetical protein
MLKKFLWLQGLDRGIAAAKLLFTPEKHLLMSIGGAYMYMGLGDYAQDPAVHYGKLLRLNEDGLSGCRQSLCCLR